MIGTKLNLKNTRTSTFRAKAFHQEVNSELKHVGRQRDDDGQNKFLQINDSKENLSYIIIRMNLIQYKKLKALALCLGRGSTEPNFKLHLLRLEMQGPVV